MVVMMLVMMLAMALMMSSHMGAPRSQDASASPPVQQQTAQEDRRLASPAEPMAE